MPIYRGAGVPGTGSTPTGDASDILIEDAGGLLTSENVEDALQETQAALDVAEAAIVTDVAALATHEVDTTTHGTTGDIVGESDTQTLTNKTIVVANNTITTAASGNLVATELDAALAELDGQDTTNATAISDHLADTGDAHDASAISNVAAGDIVATDVQAAINELDTEKQPIDATLTALAGVLTAANKVPYATATDTASELDFLDEDTLVSDSATAVASQQSIKAYIDALVNPFTEQLLHIQDQKTTGTPGGASVATGYTTRDLNTVITNEIGGASLSSNLITLPAGTYMISASAPSYKADKHRVILHNSSDSANIIFGTSEKSNSGSQTTTRSFIDGRFTLAAEKDVRLRHYTETIATNGLGLACSDGDIEVYTDVRIWKVS